MINKKRVEKVSFKLKDPKSKDPTLIYMIVNWRQYEMINGVKRYKPLKYSTGEKVKPNDWNGHPTYRAKANYSELNTTLNNLQDAAFEIIDKLKLKNKLSQDNFKRELTKEFHPEIQEKNYVDNLNAFIAKYIDEIDTGTRLTEKGKLFVKVTVKGFTTFKNVLNEYQKAKHKVLDFDSITLDFYSDYKAFLTNTEIIRKDKVIKVKYAPNTVGRHIKHLKTIMRAARDEGLHANNEFERKKFKIIEESTQQIYLTESEINTLHKFDLSETPELEKVRDVFLVGCYTAQRYSDFSRIRKAHIMGNNIVLTQKKTGEIVIIPIMPALREILIRYDYNLPYVYEQKINKNIKIIGKLAEIETDIPITITTGGLTIEKIIPKNQLIKTHTARRSGCTNMYLAGIPTIDIMKFSGHRTEKEFLKYIRVTKEQTAANYASHPYFSNSKLKVV